MVRPLTLHLNLVAKFTQYLALCCVTRYVLFFFAFLCFAVAISVFFFFVAVLLGPQVHELEAEMDSLNKPHSQFAQVECTLPSLPKQMSKPVFIS